MGCRTAAIDRLSFLSRAESRVCLMECLLASGPLTQRELQDRLSYSRSTVTRSLDSLEDIGWITDSTEGYRLTAAGRPIIESFSDTVETIETAEELAPFLEWFPLSSVDIGIEPLREGEITVATDGDPQAPSRKQAELLQSTSCFRGLFSSIDIDTTRLLRDRTVAGNLDAELVISPDVAATIRTEPFAPLFDELLATNQHTTHISEEIPMYLGLAEDGPTQVGVVDDRGFPRALLESHNSAVRSWAETLFAEHRQTAVDQLTTV